jgi:hypothetical protein
MNSSSVNNDHDLLLYYVKVCGWIEVMKLNKAACLENVLLANEELSLSKGPLLRKVCFPKNEASLSKVCFPEKEASLREVHFTGKSKYMSAASVNIAASPKITGSLRSSEGLRRAASIN